MVIVITNTTTTATILATAEYVHERVFNLIHVQ